MGFSLRRKPPAVVAPPPVATQSGTLLLILLLVAAALLLVLYAWSLWSGSKEKEGAEENSASRLRKRHTVASLRPAGERVTNQRRPPAVPSTASLKECEVACKIAFSNALKGLGYGQKYTDADWGVSGLSHTLRVLYTDDERPGWDCTVTPPEAWQRLSDWCSSPVLVSDGYSLGDVRQGQVGDCYLIGAIASVVSARPDLLNALFVAHDVEKARRHPPVLPD